MSEFDYKKIAEIHFKYYSKEFGDAGKYIDSTERELDFENGFEAENDAKIGSFESCVKMLEAEISISSDSGWLNYIGAGIIEDSLVYCGEDMIRYLENLDKNTKSNWQIAINAVWKCHG